MHKVNGRNIQKGTRDGRLDARERIELLLDSDSFEEFGALMCHLDIGFGGKGLTKYGEGVITGTGKINGRPVCVYSQDFTVDGGSLSYSQSEKICKVMDMAIDAGIPIIAMNESGGARVQEGINALAGYGEIFRRNVQASGVVPQIASIFGPCAGGAVYSPSLQDFILMNRKDGLMFVTGPKVVKQVIHEDVTSIELGGAEIHSRKSGVAHLLTEDDADTVRTMQKLLSYLPLSSNEMPPKLEYREKKYSGSSLNSIIPENPREGYDVRKVIRIIADLGEFFEIAELFAPNIVVGFSRMNGYVIGVVANQPLVKAGILDINASVKAARFVRFCDAFNIPLVSLVDVPGFMPGTEQEHSGIIRHGAKLLYAFSEATVPRITIFMRKAYGGAYIIMNSRHLGADVVYAWPTAEIAVMGSRGAIEILFRKHAAMLQNPDAFIAEKIQQYEDKFYNPEIATERGYIDDVINPDETRLKIIHALEVLVNKNIARSNRKHGCMPL